jgi:hypothetical protein
MCSIIASVYGSDFEHSGFEFVYNLGFRILGYSLAPRNSGNQKIGLGITVMPKDLSGHIPLSEKVEPYRQKYDAINPEREKGMFQGGRGRVISTSKTLTDTLRQTR